MPVSTLLCWLQRAGLWERRRSRKPHRRRRARREHCGELVQMDGSYHDWFEGRRGWAVLMVMIDDATGRVFARFFENESWRSAATILRAYVQQQGLPRVLDVDQHGIYRSDREASVQEVLAGKEPQTQFGRALAELGVELILARSPQAKGRVERMNGTLQDRLVKALRRSQIPTWSKPMRSSKRRFCPSSTPNLRSRRRSRRMCISRSQADCDLGRVLSLQQERGAERLDGALEKWLPATGRVCEHATAASKTRHRL